MPNDDGTLTGRLTLKAGAELIAIAAGVFLGLTADAAWEARQEKAELRTALQDLQAELNESLPLLDVTEQRIIVDLGYTRGLLAAPEETLGAVAADSLGVVIESLFRPNTSDNNASAILLALDGARIRELQDNGLRTAALQWRQNQEELIERGAVTSSGENQVIELLGRDPEVAAVLAGYDGGDWTTTMSRETLVRLSHSPEVRALIARKALQAAIHLDWLTDLRSSAKALIAEVERVLADF